MKSIDEQIADIDSDIANIRSTPYDVGDDHIIARLEQQRRELVNTPQVPEYDQIMRDVRKLRNEAWEAQQRRYDAWLERAALTEWEADRRGALGK